MSGEVEARWALVLPHREHLLAVARRRCTTAADAEDCVHEAMLRVVQFEGLDPVRVGALLTSVTVRLALDMHRARVRAQRNLPRLVTVPSQHQAPDEAVLDSDEARWLAAQLERLPEREREVLRERAAGYSAGEAAARLSLSYKAAESAFTRARGRMRGWAGTAVLLGAEYLRRLRQRPAVAYASMAVVSAGCVVLSSLPQPASPRAERRTEVPAIAAVPAQSVVAAAATTRPPAGAQWSATGSSTTAVSVSGRVAVTAAPAGPRRQATSNPKIANSSTGTPLGTVSITVVGWVPPGPTGHAASCLEQQELVHSDGTLGCPKQ